MGETEPRSFSSFTWILLLVAGVLFLLFVLRPSGISHRGGTSHAAVGTELSDLQLLPLTGSDKPINIDDLAGKVTLINFWGTWCPPCIAEFPHIVQIGEEFEQYEDFQLLSVSCGTSPNASVDELEEDTRMFLESRNAAIKTYADPDVITRQALVKDSKSSSFGYPTTVLLDRNGVIRALWDTGYAPGLEKEIHIAVKGLLIP